MLFGLLAAASASHAAVFNLGPGPADGAAGSLRAAITVANANGENDTINLAAGTYTLTIANSFGQENNAAEGDLDITEVGFSITIQGAGAASTSITQGVLDRLFQVFPGTTFNLNDVTISGGTAVDNGTTGVFPGNGGSGGGILNDGGVVGLQGSIVENNTAVGNVSNEGGGGIYQFSGSLTLSGGTRIQSNLATGTNSAGGGIYMANGTLTAQSQTQIRDNSANRVGGGLQIENGIANISGGATNISDNDANGTAGTPNPGNGGGLNIEAAATVTLNNIIVSGNEAANEGGGLWNSAGGTLNVISTQVNNNTAEGNGGGGIFNNGGTLDIDSGAGPTTVNGNMTTGANGAGHGGGVLSVGGAFTIDGLAGQISTVNSNTAAGFGGGISLTGGSLNVTLTNIGNNQGGLRGGGIHFENATVSLSGVTNVFDNQANFGGGVWQDSGIFTLSADSVVNSNDAVAGGGGGFYFNANTTTNIFGSVTNNTTASGGGGFLHDGRNLIIDGGTITGNTAASIGGAIQIVNNLRVANILNNSLIDGNMAGAHGGGVSIDERGGTLTVSNSTISNNVADSVNDSDGNGGGINNFGAGTVTVSNSTISGNTAVNGGGIYNGDLGGSSGTLDLTTVTISGNTAVRSGGGLYQRAGAGTFSLVEVSIEGNAANGTTATRGGGGIYNDGFAMNLGNSVAVSNNTATMGSGSGGGIFNHTGGVLTLNGTIVTGNQANRAGGGIEDNSGAGLGVTLTNAALDGNGAIANPGNGGGLHVTGAGDVQITSGTIINNGAASEGGGLWNGTGTMTVDGGSIDRNTASGSAADNGGGGIFNAGGAVSVQNGASITNNRADGTAGSGGGVFNDVGGTVTISNATITGNQAARAGGGIEDNSGAGLGLTLTNTTLSNNFTDSNPGNGGGLHVTGAGDVNITGGSVSSNDAALEGGGLWNGTGTMTVINVTINGNTASGAAADDGGGGIFNNGGIVNIQNGSITNNGAGGAAGNGGGIHVNGGMLSANGVTMTGNNREGIFAGNGGAVDLTNVTSTALILGLEGDGAGALSLTGGLFSAIRILNTASVTTNGAVTSTGPIILETTGNIDVQTGGLSGAANLSLRPGGVATFASGTSSNYGGTVTLFTGSAVVDGVIGGAGSQFTVEAPALLGGSGQIQRNLIVGGTLAPGPIAVAPGDTGILTIVGDVGFGAGSQFNVGINALGAGTGHDQLAVTGLVGMALGVPGVNLTGGAATTFADGDTFVIINNDAADPISGNFANAVPPSPPASIVLGAEQFDFDYLGGDGNDFVLGPTLSTDLAITKTDGVASAIPGGNVTYTITASNNGMTAVGGNSVTDNFPAACTSVNWTCMGAGGGTCSAAGTGNISDTVDLPAGASVTYTATCNIDPSATGTLDNTASVAIGPGVMEFDPTNNSATDSDTLVPTADLSVTKDDGVATAVPGTSVTYTIVASNPGPSDDPSVNVSDSFPATLSCSYTSAASGGATGNGGGSGNLAETLNLPAGSSVTYTAICSIDPAATGTLSNTATINGSVTDPMPGNNSATDTDTLTPQADLDISKSDGVTTAVPGQSVIYTIVASNAVGPSDLSATVSDAFPAACASVSWTCVGAGGGSCTAAGSGNIADAVSLPVGASVSYSATCNVASAATGTVDNTASVAAAAGGTDPNPANDSASDSDVLDPQADLVVTKDDGVTSATPGGSVTYAIGVSNAGPSDAPGSSVTDTFPAFCTAVNWTCVGASGGTCTAGPVAGDIADTADIPAGGSVTYSATCDIDMMATGTLDNTATAAVGAGVTELNPGNNSATDSDTLTPNHDLSISKDDGVTSATPGTSVTYTIVASNAGPSDAAGATVTDNFPAACTSVSWTCVGAGGGTCTAAGSGSIGDTIDLPVGGTVTYSATCDIDAAATGTLDNTASIAPAAGSGDPNGANDSATDSDTLVPDHDLAISKDDGATAAVPGSSVTYAIVASNAGPSDAVGATVTDSFPAICTSVTWTCAAAGGATCAASGSGNISELVNVPVGGTATFSATCAIDAAATGTLDNTASIAVAAGTTDPVAANNSATDSDTLTPQADLAVTKTDNLTTVQVNGTGTYVITASNAGPSDAPGSTVTDVFPANATPGAWTCTGAGGGICAASGSGSIAATVDLPAGSSVSFSVAVTYGSTIGIVSNTATVATSATVTDPNAANNSATDTTEIVSPATLSATKVGIANTTVSGGSLNYVIEISNAGPQNQLDNPGPEMVDVLPFGYVYLSATASSGTLSYDPPTRTLEWSGPVAVGQVISISINGSIDPAVAGMSISNQAELRFDADGNGSNEASALSDDPNQPGPADPTVISIGELVQVPSLDRLATLLLALLLMGVGVIGIRARG